MEHRHGFNERHLPADVARTVLGGVARGAGAVADIGITTGWHLRRLAAIVASSVARVDTEVRDLVWDVRDTAVTRLDAQRDDIEFPPGVGHVRLQAAHPRR